MSDGWAQFSDDKRYRYQLGRDLGRPGSDVVFVGLNPSKAGADEDDATVRRWTRFTRDWGYARFYAVNLFGYIATDPRQLLRLDRDVAVGPDNDEWLRQTITGRDVVVCWGAHGGVHERDRRVMNMLWPGSKSVRCFGLTRGGHPMHPLRLRADTKLCSYDMGVILMSGRFDR